MSKNSIHPNVTRRQAEALDQLKAKIQKALWRGASAEDILELSQLLEKAENFFLLKEPLVRGKNEPE